MEKVKFWWATVGDAGPEPVVVDKSSGRQLIYTIGCADPLPRNAVRLLSVMPIPLTPEERAMERVLREQVAQESVSESHGWKKWNP